MRTETVYASNVYMHIRANGFMRNFIIFFRANVDSEEYISSAYSIQKLKDENTSLKSELSQLSHE